MMRRRVHEGRGTRPASYADDVVYRCRRHCRQDSFSVDGVADSTPSDQTFWWREKMIYMATISIRNVDHRVLELLRIQAARQSRSAAAEARAILVDDALREPVEGPNSGQAIMTRFGELGGVELEPDRPSVRGGEDALEEGPDGGQELGGPGAVHGMPGAIDCDERGIGH
jgi:plasmid stability protein